jgi:hypothetical protein
MTDRAADLAAKLIRNVDDGEGREVKRDPFYAGRLRRRPRRQTDPQCR